MARNFISRKAYQFGVALSGRSVARIYFSRPGLLNKDEQRSFPGQLSLPGRSKVHSGLQEGKEGLLPSLIDLFYQVGAKFGVAYQEGLWILFL